MIPFSDSEELLRASVLSREPLIEIGNDHRLTDPEPLRAMLEVCTQLTDKANKRVNDNQTSTES